MRSESLQALRFFLLNVLGPISPAIEVVQAQDNRVPEPAADNFVIMTLLFRDRLGMPVHSHADGFPDAPQVRAAMQPTQFDVQLDLHGPLSQDMGQVIGTLFADEYGFTRFEESGFDVRPLYCGQMRQMPFINGEQQVEFRWTVDVSMEAKPIVTTGQQFAAELRIGTVSVDTLTQQPNPPRYYAEPGYSDPGYVNPN